MKLEFASRKLERCYLDGDEATRAFGPKIGRVFLRRIATISAANDLSALYSLRSLRLHPLKGEREGQLAMDLDKSWRLAITYNEKEKSVRIEEVTNHYDD